MKAMLEDFKEATKKPINIAICVAVVALSAATIQEFGYLVWRRFPIPLIVVTGGGVFLLLSKIFAQSKWGSAMLRANGLIGIVSGALMLTGAFLDAWLSPEVGYFLFFTFLTFCGMGLFNLFRVLKRARQMSQESIEKTTLGVEVAVAEMRIAGVRAKESLDEINQEFPDVMRTLAL